MEKAHGGIAPREDTDESLDLVVDHKPHDEGASCES